MSGFCSCLRTCRYVNGALVGCDDCIGEANLGYLGVVTVRPFPPPPPSPQDLSWMPLAYPWGIQVGSTLTPFARRCSPPPPPLPPPDGTPPTPKVITGNPFHTRGIYQRRFRHRSEFVVCMHCARLTGVYLSESVCVCVFVYLRQVCILPSPHIYPGCPMHTHGAYECTYHGVLLCCMPVGGMFCGKTPAMLGGDGAFLALGLLVALSPVSGAPHLFGRILSDTHTHTFPLYSFQQPIVFLCCFVIFCTVTDVRAVCCIVLLWCWYLQRCYVVLLWCSVFCAGGGRHRQHLGHARAAVLPAGTTLTLQLPLDMIIFLSTDIPLHFPCAQVHDTSILVSMCSIYGKWRCVCAVSLIQGLGRGIFESTNKSVIADFCPPPRTEAGFASFVILSGSGELPPHFPLQSNPAQMHGSIIVKLLLSAW
eukprot:COSAG01_NODE_2464_length_7647_cov_2.339428_2_plen_422_part_00